MNKHLLPGAALLGLVSGNASGATVSLTKTTTLTETASASNPSPIGSTGLGPLGAVGGIGGPVSFDALDAGSLVVTVDQTLQTPGFSGHVYQLFVDGNSLGFTSGVELFGPDFSTGTFTVPITAGAHNFDINDQILSYLGSPSPYGSALPAPDDTVPGSYTPSNVTITLAERVPEVVPEPGSLSLIASGLLGFGFLRRRRNRS